MSFRIAPFLRQRLFTTSARARNAIPMESVAATQLTASAHAVPKLGRIARWYLPTMALIAVGMATASRRTINTLDAANRHIGFGVTNALNEANRKVHMAREPTQEQKNMMLLEMYGERSSLEDMERAIAGIESRVANEKDRNKMLEEAYGDKSSLKDLQRAMELYEVQ
ncbi:hypothetical protein CC86DRAFT_144891 [Ophiobolus disseminans]|uniref:Uncharacterized protein n=1 Tax=Ophiobolus disseminans TaxID=1469910 RepID=A0A6A6ZGF8_9PLEO|nr:hypothetical protein CC86DRAFT_144891 [Ophiobolus disseminans]